MNPKLLTSVEPITLDQAKVQCYIPVSDNDSATESILTSLITAVRMMCENYTWLTLFKGTYEYKLDEFPEVIETIFPIDTVASITYKDKNDDPQTFVDFEVKDGQILPLTTFPDGSDIVVTFDSGSADIAEPLKHGMLMVIKYHFDNRDAVAVSDGRSVDVQELPLGVKELWGAYSERVFV